MGTCGEDGVHFETVSVNSSHDGRLNIFSLAHRLAIENHGVGVVFVHVFNDVVCVVVKRVGFSRNPVVMLKPRHLSESTDVPNGCYLKAEEKEIPEIDISTRLGMMTKVGRPCPINVYFLKHLAFTNQRNPGGSQGVFGGVVRYQEGSFWILHQILRVFSQTADQKNRLAFMHGKGDEGAVGVTIVLFGNTAQRGRCVPLCEGSRFLCM